MSQNRQTAIPFTVDMLIMLALCAATACFYYGFAVISLIAACVLSCVVCDAAGTFLLKREITLKDLSAVITGLCVSLTLPVGCPLWLAVLAGAVSVCLGKLPFGDHDRSPFVPPAVGIAFVSVLYPSVFFDYSSALRSSSVTQASLASMLKNGVSVNATAPALLNILAGNCPGPVGTGCTFLMAAFLVYLAIRNFSKFACAFGFTAVCALAAVLFPRVLSGAQVSLVMELGGGILLFSAVFLMTYPNGKLSSVPVCLLYGALGGAICMLIRRLGASEEGAPFAVLIMNALAPLFEKAERKLLRHTAAGGGTDE